MPNDSKDEPLPVKRVFSEIPADGDEKRYQLITNFGQFIKHFGEIQKGNSDLANAVSGFFANGGSRCYVIRVSAAADNIPGDEFTNALVEFERVDEIAIVAAPGITEKTKQEAILTHCNATGDRFGILDGNPAFDVDDPSGIKNGVGATDRGAIYYPYIQVANRHRDFADGDPKRLFVPPSGHVAGIYARVDAERGVHKAPANEVVLGAVGLQRLVSHNEQSNLNDPEGINVIRDFSGNIRVWGARTIGGEGADGETYINVRRLLLFLAESIDQSTAFAVFEPNSPPLWSKITRTVNAFLTNVWRDGALFGNTPEQAFFVKCDEETNPPEVRDLGQVITEIGVAPVKPAEFVIFRISQDTNGQE
ncbi:MAG: phage tail sheath subtilisin-like domain-containing protein [Planctomycetota bacterium]